MQDMLYRDADRVVADKMSSWWSNFAKNLNPNGPGLEHWAPYDPKHEVWFNIGTTPKPEPFNSAGVDLLVAIQEEGRRQR